ncbi:hypothetical protein SAMN03159304_01948 [Pseudomonas sp. NFACC24-1]|nr:hypothetical protein SAMN03159304_01948 [Pseudomonas sp. NFACC24-1]
MGEWTLGHHFRSDVDRAIAIASKLAMAAVHQTSMQLPLRDQSASRPGTPSTNRRIPNGLAFFSGSGSRLSG